MRTISFVNSHKENESRIAILPNDINISRNPSCIYIEKNYGIKLGIDDSEYQSKGCHIVSREIALKQDIICDPKIGDAEYLKELKHQIVFGWIHAVQNREITDVLINNQLTAYAWEDMYEKGRHIFWRNNEIAGEAAIMHAYLRHGIFPYNTKVAVLGRGNVARGAIKTLNYMGADITTYDRRTESLFREELGRYDVIVNAILWDTSRNDHIICMNDLKRMKPGAMIIDVSCDRNGGIETSIPTSIDNPDYFVEGIRHYVVDHTPSLFYKTASIEISKNVAGMIDYFVEEKVNANDILTQACCIKDGTIIDERIKLYHKIIS